MTKKEKKQWLGATRKLRRHYEQYKLDEIPPSYRRGTGKLCALCQVQVDNNIKRSGMATCESCLWSKFEGGYCGSKNWFRQTTQQRLDRLDRWEELLEGE